MPEVPGAPPSPRTALFWDGDQWRYALVDNTGHLQIDVLSNVGLDNALQSVATDRLIVRGEDQLFALGGVLANPYSGVISGADGFFDSGSPLAGFYWVVTTITAWDQTGATTIHAHINRHNGVDVYIHEEEHAFATWRKSKWSGVTVLDVDDVVRVYFTGAGAGDTVNVHLSGYYMPVEA